MRSASPKASWAKAGEALARELLVIPAASRASFRGEWESIDAAERALDDRLTVGLLGGTGVGKSTLINALAGAEISQSGDRRPTTSHVIVYRHRSTRLPEDLPRGDLAEPEILHDTQNLERVILLDFPDFDSVEASHHEILARCSAHLDVLLVIVDDVKYADLRLHELLRKLPQAHENLHGVLNKIDRLEARYPGRSRQVAGEILDDFAAKLEAHAGIRIDRTGLLAVSALNALRKRARGEECDSGEFDRLVEGIEEYRAEKRRRAAKELNLEARKQALFARLREVGLDSRPAERVDRAVAELDRRRGELDRLLSGISPAIFSSGERKRGVASVVGRTASRLGFPIDLILTIVSHLPFRKAALDERVEISPPRVRQHYKTYLDAVRNLRRELSMELAEILPQGAFREDEDSFADSSTELERRISARLDALPSRSKLWNHALAGAAAFLWLWSVIHPSLEAVLKRLGGEAGASWGSVAKELFFAVISSLSPISLVSFALAILAAYGVTAVLVWMRRVQAVEAGVTEAEDVLRERVRAVGALAIDSTASAIALWRRERAELSAMLGQGQ